MDLSHHYNYGESVSYPHGYNFYGEEGHFLAGHKDSSINQLYSPALLNLDRQTQRNLSQLKQKLMQIDPCYAFGIEHWHPDHRKKKGELIRLLISRKQLMVCA